MILELTGNSFTGSYSYTLDAKGRVNIPAKMRKALNPANDRTFMATRGADPCVILYPVDIWKKIEEKLINLNKGRALNRYFTRNFIRYAEAVQYDHQGRVALPAELIKYAGINRSVEIVGMIDRIEVWDQERLKEFEKKFAERQDELEAIANEVNF